MTEAVKYIVFPIVGMVALLYLFPILFNNWREEKDAENKAAETEFLLMADLSSKERRQFMEAESNNASLPVLLPTSSHIRVTKVVIFLIVVGVWFAMAGISFLVDHVVPKDPVDDMPKSRRGKRKWLCR
jgi:hypothetical protein